MMRTAACLILAAALTASAVTTPAATAAGADDAPAARELTALVSDFLAGVSRNDAAVHERFWADDLVYTRAAGERIGKADILRDVKAGEPPKPGAPATVYGAEDMRVRQYGDTAVVAFQLVATTGATVDRYLNTGTFVKRGGRWQAVAWQATRVPAAGSTTSAAPSAAQPNAAASPAPSGGGMGQVFLVLLKRGPAWTPEVTDQSKALQAAHLANIKKMWEEKKLIIAGPDGDDHEMRGVFVFAAKDKAEAQLFAETDPAVKAGRLVPEIHSWWVERNALPEAGAYCR